MFNLVVSVMLAAGLAARVDAKPSAATVMDKFAYTPIHTYDILYITLYIYIVDINKSMFEFTEVILSNLKPLPW